MDIYSSFIQKAYVQYFALDGAVLGFASMKLFMCSFWPDFTLPQGCIAQFKELSQYESLQAFTKTLWSVLKRQLTLEHLSMFK